MDVLSGKVVMALELIPTFKSLLGRDIPKGTTEYGMRLSNITPDRVKDDRERLAIDIQGSIVPIPASGPRFAPEAFRSRFQFQ